MIERLDLFLSLLELESRDPNCDPERLRAYSDEVHKLIASLDRRKS